MITTTLVALQTFVLSLLPSPARGFNTSLMPPAQMDKRPVFDPISAQGDKNYHQVLVTASKVIKQKKFVEKDYRIKTVVIDPGHGGHDPGCLGSVSQEKHIALAIGKKISAAISAQFPDIKVIMTRETDEFIPLHERAAIANRNNADLFISIHCNFMPGSSATKGTETYVMGLHTAEQNLEVAKRENESILLEENYAQNYDFDPNSPEAHIMLSMFQHAFLEQSILFAEKVEEHINVSAGRRSRGVKQAGFMVLKATTMPSVLVETGFLSNKEEEGFLSTAEGQAAVADAILQAFSAYKSLVETGKSTPTANKEPIPVNMTPNHTAKQTQSTAQAIDIQGSPKSETSKNKPSTTNTSVKTESKIISNTPPVAVSAEQATIIFCIQLAASPKPMDTNQSKWRDLSYPIDVVKEDNYFKYQARGFANLSEALNAKVLLQSEGFPDAFLVAYKNGIKITIDQAKKELGIQY